MKNPRYFINNDKVAWRIIDGEAVIMNLNKGNYYSLNNSGAMIWNMLSENKDRSNIVEEILKEFKVSKSRAEKDLDTLLKDLLKEDLVTKKTK